MSTLSPKNSFERTRQEFKDIDLIALQVVTGLSKKDAEASSTAATIGIYTANNGCVLVIESKPIEVLEPRTFHLVKEDKDWTLIFINDDKQQEKIDIQSIPGLSKALATLPEEIHESDKSKLQSLINSFIVSESRKSPKWRNAFPATRQEQIIQKWSKLNLEKFKKISEDNYEQKDSKNTNILYILAREGDYLQLIKVLEKIKLRPEKKGEILNQACGEKKMAALLIACERGHLRIVKDLLDFKETDINITNSDGDNSLHIATSNKKYDVMNFLLEKKADSNSRNRNGLTPLMLAAQDGDVIALGILLKNAEVKVNQERIAGKGMTALYLAVVCNKPEAVKLLSENKADLNMICNEKDEKCTPIYKAFKDKNYQIVTILAAAGAALSKGDQPLIFEAIGDRDLTMVQALLDSKKIDPNAPRVDGMTPLALAEKLGLEEISKALLKAGAKPLVVVEQKEDSEHEITIHSAAEDGDLKQVETLINKSNVDEEDDYGATPLIAAIGGACKEKNNGGDISNHISVIKKLIAEGADLEKEYSEDSFTGTPVDYADYLGLSEVVDCISKLRPIKEA